MLAIDGGDPVFKGKWLDWPIINKGLDSHLTNVLENKRWAVTGFWSGDESYEQKFAHAFARQNKAEYCVPVSNGSTALVIALEALGIGYGNQVIIPALTWVATATAVLNVNAEVVLVDVDPATYCMDPVQLRNAITKKTKAIVPVHLFGCMCNMDEIMAIAREYGLKVIEDNAQTHFARWDNKYAGTIGDAGSFSFQQGKILASGEGGAVVTNNKETYMKLQQLKCDSRVLIEEGKRKYGYMDVDVKGEIHGSNYNLSEFQSAVLFHQLQLIDDQNKTRAEHAAYLDERISEIEGLDIMVPYPKNNVRTYYGYIVKFDPKYFGNINGDQMAEILRYELDAGSFYLHAPYPAVNKQPYFCPWKNKKYIPEIAKTEEYWHSLSFPVAESANREAVFFLHSFLLNTKEYLDSIAEAFMKIKKHFA